MSKTQNLVNYVLSVVATETEITCDDIMSRRRTAETVDARQITVMALLRSGLYIAQTADAMNLTPRYVQYIKTNFNDRIRYNPTLRRCYERIAKQLGNNNEPTMK